MADFPVPVGPMNSNGLLWVRNASKKNICRAVSSVGIISSLTCQTRIEIVKLTIPILRLYSQVDGLSAFPVDGRLLDLPQVYLTRFTAGLKAERAFQAAKLS